MMSLHDPTVEEQRIINSVLSDIQKRWDIEGLSIGEILGTWSAFVQEIERGYKLTIYDYANDLMTRDLLDEIIERLPPRVRDELAADVEQWDDRYRLATRPWSVPILPGPDVAAIPRWKRIPRVLLAELRADLISDGVIPEDFH
jgi:hypothetical protein